LNGGQQVVGGLLLPGNYQTGSRYPLVICVYGEGKADDLIRFGGWLCGHGLPQLLASRGYAYLVTGGPIRVGTPMTDIASNVLLPLIA
jgi:dipeptidyl aminopeptidase/acylaminoacyl peptidase